MNNVTNEDFDHPASDHAGQTEFKLAEFTIEADEIEMSAAAEAGERDDASAPHLDTTLEAPIEVDTSLMHAINSIPAKMAFKIGEAAEMVGVKQYVLRYWESEFETLRPRKSANGQRIYSRKDVETAMMIKKLLYSDRFSIEGARSALRNLKSNVKSTVLEEKTTERLVKSQETIVGLLQSLVKDIQRARSAI